MNNKITKLENDDFKVEKNDICIMCGKDTGVPTDLHVDFRDNYIDGSGQLCNKCAKKYE